MSFATLTIRKRIYGGATMLVAISVGLAAFAINESTVTETRVTRLGLLSDNNTRVLQVAGDLEAIRRTSRSYKATGDVSALKENREIIAGTMQTLSAAAAATVVEERRRTYESFKDELRKYSAKMDAQESLTNDMMRDRGKLFSGGDDLGAKTTKLVEAIHAEDNARVNALATNAESAILLVRVANWRYLATLDAKGTDIQSQCRQGQRCHRAPRKQCRPFWGHSDVNRPG